MILLLLLLAVNFEVNGAYDNYQYYEEDTTKHHRKPIHKELEFEPVVNIPKQKAGESNINCEEFSQYALNCTLESALIYNSTKKSPPMPAKMMAWCTAIRHLTNCAIDWNSECKDVTESHFNEESIKGHMHVVNNICDDELFIAGYDDLPSCIDKAANMWEACYIEFKSTVDYQKNLTQEWTHYMTHFELCCARTQFRRCTLNTLFLQSESKCPHEQALILQKFSVVISKGDVFQDCEENVLYKNCLGGDPRPSTRLLKKLMNAEDVSLRDVAKGTTNEFKLGIYWTLVIYICLLKVCL